ncbi:hypothetical protein HaLaN_23562 [Haematococcus lacustris]|uniref:Uncharacterized protein n=1 Tax=Haematococcus lacustris TaxID=44745 RepID=A0A6A0A1H3_HAELA|nr:hypothetical protein HaLaN_23562 [Haematococcus lacustris]
MGATSKDIRAALAAYQPFAFDEFITLGQHVADSMERESGINDTRQQRPTNEAQQLGAIMQGKMDGRRALVPLWAVLAEAGMAGNDSALCVKV